MVKTFEILPRTHSREESSPAKPFQDDALHINVARISPHLKQNKSPGYRWREVDGDVVLVRLDVKARGSDICVFFSRGDFFFARNMVDSR